MEVAFADRIEAGMPGWIARELCAACLGAFVTTAMVCPTEATSPSQVTIRTLAISGQRLPGIRWRIGSAGAARINAHGDAVIGARLEGASDATDAVLLAHYHDSGLLVAAREGWDTPFAPGTFRTFSIGAIDDEGRVHIPHRDPWGHWLFDRFHGLSLLLDFGSPTSAVPEIWRGEVLAISGRGHVVVEGTDADQRQGLWVGIPGERFEARMKAGWPAPDAPSNTFFGSPCCGRSAVNDQGDLLFEARLETASMDDLGGSLWIADADGLNMLAQQGSEAPGAPAGAVFSHDTSFSSDLNRGADVVFQSELEPGPGGVSSEDRTGIWISFAGAPIALVLREGLQAPDLPSGAIVDYFLTPPQLDDAGRLLIEGGLRLDSGGVTEENDQVIWFGRPDSLRVLAREGQAVPGASGIVYRTLLWSVLGESGHVAFQAALGGPHVTKRNDEAIFSVSNGTQPVIVLRDGQRVKGHAIEWLDLPDAYAQQRTHGVLNDGGQIAISARFTDGAEGSLLATVAVPEPAEAILLGVGAVVLATRPRRRVR